MGVVGGRRAKCLVCVTKPPHLAPWQISLLPGFWKLLRPRNMFPVKTKGLQESPFCCRLSSFQFQTYWILRYSQIIRLLFFNSCVASVCPLYPQVHHSVLEAPRLRFELWRWGGGAWTHGSRHKNLEVDPRPHEFYYKYCKDLLMHISHIILALKHLQRNCCDRWSKFHIGSQHT